MASLWKHPKSRFFSACYTNKDGKQVKRSTKLTDRKKALVVAQELERAEDLVRGGVASTVQLRKIFNDLVERTTGDTILAPSVEAYLTDWLANVQAKNSKATTTRYRSTVDRFLKHLEAKAKGPITSITPSDIDAFLRARLQAGFAPKTVIVDIKSLSIAFHRAERYAVILKNPVSPVELPKTVSSQREILTHVEVKKLLDSVGYKSEWFTLILLGYYTGARLSDCSAMKWSNASLQP